MSLRTRLEGFSDPVGLPTLSRTRRLARGMCLILAILALSPLVPGTFIPAVVPALSPFVAIAALLAARTFHRMAWLGLTLGAVTLLYHRLFCHWVCPAGLCLDAASWSGRRLGRRTARFPLLGRWFVGLTLGGACLGYPCLLWLDPLARFSGLFALGDRGLGLGLDVSIAGFLAVLLLDMLWPNVWCTCLCPLGAFQDLLFALAGSLQRVASVSARLPMVLAIRYRRSPQPHRGHPPRRVFLAGAAGAIWAAVVRSSHKKESRPLRPPGALAEPTFLGVCTRCGSCARACPSGIIGQDRGQKGLASLLTPVLRFQKDYCREDCVRCTEACPSGALVRLSLQEKMRVRIGLPHVDMDLCLLADDRECSVCRSRCSYNAIRYIFSETDYTLIPQIDREKCTGCGACEAACPTLPRRAITVV